MALPNVGGHVIAQGYNCNVRAGKNASDAENIAFVSSFQATEDFQAQEANVIGILGPISIDPQGYNCTISIGSLYPSKGKLKKSQQYGDGGKVAITDFVPSRAKYMEAGAFQKIEYMDFYNKREGKVLASFTGVLVTSNGIQVEGSAYVRKDVQMRALSMDED